ncbi:HAD family hydrolase [Alkalihalophilus lindianensis]|uniref:HAD family hydrolase n=1 Tax=Alkalihalophilus lindianensis TaxID=1630542 RepID=A0ABU3XBC6_9BACI|nr:HAD family hydrolase [Alkalihalophilus lindianensis]MDV2685192.1 HAD family hydrolase [Alkalihalophilus lindianensis]
MKGIIFDFDGLIFDTETPLYEAYQQLFKEYNAELPLEKFAQIVGTGLDEFHPYRYLEELIGQPVLDEDLDLKIEEYRMEVLGDADLRKGVRDYLDQAKQLELKIALASSSERSWIDRWLAHHKIDHYFSIIRTKDDVHKIKPDPELYEQAVKGLGLKKEDVLVFEDSLNGLTAARRAGLSCVIVPNPITSQLPFEDYQYRLTSMEDIGLVELIRNLNDNQHIQAQ